MRTSLDADSPYADAAVHGDGLTSLQFRRTKGAIDGGGRAPTSRGPTSSSSSGREARSPSRRPGSASCSRPARSRTSPSATTCTWGSSSARTTPTWWRGRSSATCGSSARPARASFPTATTSAAASRSSTCRPGTARWSTAPRSPSRRRTGRATGGALIYNTTGRSEGRGRLYRFDLATRQPSPIDTGSAVRNNNDHVLSFDGTMARHQRPEPPATASRPSTPCPPAGGTPKRITRLAPSYLHGWSPDGRYLVYTGGRNGEFDIYRIAADGQRRGDEPHHATRASTTGRSTRRTGDTSTSTRPAAARCRSGG